jgi:hypothetical protein
MEQRVNRLIEFIGAYKLFVTDGFMNFQIFNQTFQQ